MASISISSPAVNLHSPGPIGDVTPGNGTFLVLNNTQYGGTLRCSNYQWAGAESAILDNGINLGLTAGEIVWYDGHYYNGVRDVNLVRVAGNILRVKDGSTGDGFLQAKLRTAANATTGLVAGALAALTTSSLIFYDASGAAYEVPCLAV